MRSPDHPVERDLDVADLRRQPPMGSVKRGHGPTRGKGGLRRYLVSGMVVVVLALFSAVVWFAYQDLMPGADTPPPLIRADAGELKREPDERGGLPVVNAESAIVQALDEPESPVRVERILPRESTAPRSTADVVPEALEAEPSPEPVAAAMPSADAAIAETPDAAAAADAAAADAESAATTTDTLDTLLAEIIETPEELGAIEPSAGPASEDDFAGAEEVPMPADGMALPESADQAAEAPSAADALGAAEAVATPSTAVTEPARPSQSPTTAAVPAPAPTATATAPDAAPSAPTAPAETTVAALPSPTLAASFNGAYRVQLLAARDEEAAAGAWAGLQARFPDALGPLRSDVQRAEIGGDTFFRLHAGPFADRADALAACEALQARGADCFVVAPPS